MILNNWTENLPPRTLVFYKSTRLFHNLGTN